MIQQIINIKQNLNQSIVKNNDTIVSIRNYKKDMLNREVEEKLLKSEIDIEKGKVKDALVVFEEWKIKYGI